MAGERERGSTIEDTVRVLGQINRPSHAAAAMVLGDHTLAFQVEAKTPIAITRVLELVYEREADQTVIRAIHESEGVQLAAGEDHQAELPYIPEGNQWAELRVELQGVDSSEPEVLLFSERPEAT
jgi:hypothetical protein